MYTNCVVRDTQLPPRYDFPHQETEVASAFIHGKAGLQGSLAPRGGPDVAISPTRIRESQEGAKFIYLWGWMKYFDVFPDTPEHTTHFCWQIVVTGDALDYVPNTLGTPPTPHTLLFASLQHTEGNYAD